MSIHGRTWAGIVAACCLRVIYDRDPAAPDPESRRCLLFRGDAVAVGEMVRTPVRPG